METVEAKERFTLLTLLANQNDRVALRCWLGFGLIEFGAAPYRRLREYCDQASTTPLDALKRLRLGQVRLPYCDSMVNRYRALLTETSRLADLEDERLIDALFPPSDPKLASIRDIAELVLVDATEPLDAQGLLSDLRLRLIYPEPPTTGNYVKIMSLHKSKGLSAKKVYVTGCVEGWIPSIDDELPIPERKRVEEEQRRLFYVALTRAEETLVLSSFHSIEPSDAYRYKIRAAGRASGRIIVQASKFLSELGPAGPRAQRGKPRTSYRNNPNHSSQDQ